MFPRYRGQQRRRFRQSRPPQEQRRLLNPRLSSKARLKLGELLEGLPQVEGGPICVMDRAQLTAHRGKLVSSGRRRGTPLHAAAFIRKRRILLETELLSRPRLLRVILVHEIFHFVWLRLGNRLREEFAEILGAEQRARARGELGESSHAKKESLAGSDRLRNSRAWREYVCESFCDTAAWVYSGVRQQAAFTLATRWRRIRESWFYLAFETGCKC